MLPTPGSRVVRVSLVLCLCRKKAGSHGEESLPRAELSMVSVKMADSHGGDIHSTLVAMPHLHLSTCHFSSVTEVSLEGCFAILGIFTDRQAVRQSVCLSHSPPSCHTGYERWGLPRVGSYKP